MHTASTDGRIENWRSRTQASLEADYTEGAGSSSTIIPTGGIAPRAHKETTDAREGMCSVSS